MRTHTYVEHALRGEACPGYVVCDKCAHVQPVPDIDHAEAQCENCGHGALWLYIIAENAEQHSRDILDRAGRRADA